MGFTGLTTYFRNQKPLLPKHRHTFTISWCLILLNNLDILSRSTWVKHTQSSLLFPTPLLLSVLITTDCHVIKLKSDTKKAQISYYFFDVRIKSKELSFLVVLMFTEAHGYALRCEGVNNRLEHNSLYKINSTKKLLISCMMYEWNSISIKKQTICVWSLKLYVLVLKKD